MDKRLRPNQSIRRRQTFRLIHNRGRFAAGKLLNLWVYRSPEGSPESSARPGIGIVVSRKVSLRANVRNLWKRRIREVFRNEQEIIKRGLRILVQAKKQSETPSYRSIEEEFKRLLGKTESLR